MWCQVYNSPYTKCPFAFALTPSIGVVYLSSYQSSSHGSYLMLPALNCRFQGKRSTLYHGCHHRCTVLVCLECVTAGLASGLQLATNCCHFGIIRNSELTSSSSIILYASDSVLPLWALCIMF